MSTLLRTLPTGPYTFTPPDYDTIMVGSQQGLPPQLCNTLSSTMEGLYLPHQSDLENSLLNISHLSSKAILKLSSPLMFTAKEALTVKHSSSAVSSRDLCMLINISVHQHFMLRRQTWPIRALTSLRVLFQMEDWGAGGQQRHVYVATLRCASSISYALTTVNAMSSIIYLYIIHMI